MIALESRKRLTRSAPVCGPVTEVTSARIRGILPGEGSLPVHVTPLAAVLVRRSPAFRDRTKAKV